jgi:uncharacterized C2H2 Zn-finger protein
VIFLIGYDASETGQDDDDDEPLGLVQLEDAYGRVKCLACGKILSNIRCGKRHYATLHQFLPQSKCKICKKLYKNDQTVVQHMLKSHGITRAMMKARIAP